MQTVPLFYVPLEVVMSKYYGESEQLLASVFSAGNEFMEGAIIFLDEVKKHSYFFCFLKNQFFASQCCV
jgi:SpoVK/Ycf46/Vps4 family AAA+-type ATPase